MVNRWTGAHDLVVALSPGGMDRMLAAVHRKGERREDEPAPGPHLLHKGWVNLPLGVAIPGHDLRGHLQFQVATPAVRVPDQRGGGRLTVSAEVFSWFQRALLSDPAPEFLHGNVSVTLGLRTVRCEGRSLVQFEARSDDLEVAFTPAQGSNAGPADVALVEAVVPVLLREAFEPVQFSLGELGSGGLEVHDAVLKPLRDGPREAVALLLALRAPDGAPPDPGLVSEVFLDSGEELALALGREFLLGLLKEKATPALSGISVSGSRLGLSFSATLDPGTLELEMQPGRLQARIEGSGSSSVGSYRFRLTVRFALAVRAGRLELGLEGEPDMDVTQGFLPGLLFGLFRGRIVDRIESAAATALAAANAELNAVMRDSTDGLLEELALPGVSLAPVRATVDPDAVILGMQIDLGRAPGAFASFRRVDRQAGPLTGLANVSMALEFSAFESWIPGGAVERYVWREVRSDGSVARQISEPHQFVGQVPVEAAGASAHLGGRLSGSSFDSASIGWPPAVWCLEVLGRQFAGAGGPPVAVSRRVCSISSVVVALDRAFGERLPIRVPDGAGGVLADVDPWGARRPHTRGDDPESRGLLLLHHSPEGAERGAEDLLAALRTSRAHAAVFPLILDPDGGARYPAGLSKGGGVAVTTDPEHRWRERFGLEEPGTVLLGARGRPLWRSRGSLDPEALAKALAGLRPARIRPPRRRQLGLALNPGDFAPDVLFPCGPQVVVALRRLRGREVLLCFWTTWSDAALEELRRLEAAHGRAESGPAILCVNDGEESAHAERVFRATAPGLKLVTDPDRSISRRYGVSCWPTVVRIDRAGRLAGARFGLEVEEAVYE